MVAAYFKHSKLNLKRDPNFNEVWLHDRIADDPSILGLGDAEVLDRERVQAGAGRLDLLLSDSDNNTRYEVEIMLGPTDPSHIIRTIEYWDIERRRYPAYDHVAVIIAEDITTRFLNVLSLFSGSIPIIAIQLDALQVDDKVLLNFVHVLSQVELRVDDQTDGADSVDRAYWEKRIGPEVLGLGDELVKTLQSHLDEPLRVTYRKRYFRAYAPTGSGSVWVSPKKKYLHVTVTVRDVDDWVGRCDEAGLPTSVVRNRRVRVTISPESYQNNKELICSFLADATAALK